ncbi:MAG: hypothetical protein HY366_02630 [Candidatus Aenigmarchaeota archaeon]|nr:hypothetical protein [Candidatus Aenigmarchaeota archaeon]
MEIPSREEIRTLQKQANAIAQNLERLGYQIEGALFDVRDPKNPVTLNPSPFVVGIRNPRPPFSDGRYAATLYLARTPSMVGHMGYGDWAFEIEDIKRLEDFMQFAEKLQKRYPVSAVDVYMVPRKRDDVPLIAVT